MFAFVCVPACATGGQLKRNWGRSGVELLFTETESFSGSTTSRELTKGTSGCPRAQERLSVFIVLMNDSVKGGEEDPQLTSFTQSCDFYPL